MNDWTEIVRDIRTQQQERTLGLSFEERAKLTTERSEQILREWNIPVKQSPVVPSRSTAGKMARKKCN